MRTADTTVLAKSSKEVLSAIKDVMEDNDLEALEFDFDSITVLLTEFDSSKLGHENVQWVFWHLLEHVMVDVCGASEHLSDDEAAGLWENMDVYMQELEDSFKKRGVKVVCPRLEALLHEYWTEAREAETGRTPVPSYEKPASTSEPNLDPEEDDDDPEDEEDEEDDGEE
jgi:hypothetical protein